MGDGIERIAVLNRGEAARRCLRAIRELGQELGAPLVGIAFYTEPDRLAPFVREADDAVDLGPALRGPEGALRPAYLDHERVLAALRASRADAVWPGWGFLAEDASFVERLAALGLAFLGPGAETMRLLGDKVSSKRLAESARVPVLPWSGGTVERGELGVAARKLGFPVLLKAAAGGGGRGIRRVDAEHELDAAFASAQSEAAHAFGDPRVFLESLAKEARHVEVQMAADQHGRVLAVGLRDCSVQRRHQKIVEEGPPPGLPDALLDEMREASVRLLRQASYTGVATCEYLVTPDQRYYFLEVNPRLQVEHGVTELLTGFDLVKWQVRIANGERLPPEPPAERGHAIEVRLCAEDPAAGFAPSPGRIALLDLPAGPGVRVDAGVESGNVIPAEFDSLVAKVIAHGATREEALARLARATSDLAVVVEGGMVNKGFLLDILEHPEFRAASCHNGWLERAGIAAEPEPCVEALVVAAILAHQNERGAMRLNFFAEAARGRPRHIPPSTGSEVEVEYAGNAYRLRVFAVGGWLYRVHLDEGVVEVTFLEQGPHRRQLVIGDRSHTVLYSESDVELRLEVDGRLHRVLRDTGGKVRAPAPALVIEVAVQPGASVRAGQRLGLLEAMKTETAFFAPVSGTVREVLARPGERVAAGDVILVIEPSGERGAAAPGAPGLRIEAESDPLDALFDAERGEPDLERAAQLSSGARSNAVRALRSETRRILMGYDVNPDRADTLVRILEASVSGISPTFRAELAQLARAVEVFADLETLFSRAPERLDDDEFGLSNDALMAMYLRRVGVEGAGIAPEFLDTLRRALAHYDVPSLEPTDGLSRALLRLYATRTTLELRARLSVALLHLMIRLGEQDETFARFDELESALDGLALLRGTVPPAVADLASHARFVLFERRRTEAEDAPAGAPVDVELSIVPPPDPAALAALAAPLGLDVEEARRIELWRLENFELERVETFEGLYTFHGRSRDGSGDERLFCIAEVNDLGPGAPERPDVAAFERRFQEAIEALRLMQGERDPARRLGWNRLYVLVRPPIVPRPDLLSDTMRRLTPQTGHLGLEKVIVRLVGVAPERRDASPRRIELLAGNPTNTRVESSVREAHALPLAVATRYERRVAAALARGLVDPYELARLFSDPPPRATRAPSDPIGPGAFAEHDLVEGRAVPVARPPGQNSCGIVFGVVTTPTAKYPEGMRRVLIMADSSFGMGALAAPECERLVAALDLAEREGLPVEWVAVSSGARIAMDSGTENLDATARVVRRLVTFTDGGGEVNLILPGVNVGAQSYFDALATMGLQTRGILVMLASASMVLTGRAALEVSGGVAAEDEVGIGGYERIMGPSGQAHYQARDLADAYAILLQHYATSYRAPGEPGPRRFATSDPADRDITQSSCDAEEGFDRVGDVFSDAANPGRKRTFAMRPLLRALADQDAGWLERWRPWSGAETAIVWDSHLGGHPVTLIGVESRPLPRTGYVPNDGPDAWTAGTLFPQSSKKVARALNAASGVRPVVILANLSGFDGSPESMRRGVLELGAEIARAVVRFRGRLLFNVVSRYHGGAYVVFSRELNDELRATALSGSYASVIGGAAAAAVVFPREVRRRANADPRVLAARARMASESNPAARVALAARLDAISREVRLEKQAEVAADFDGIHTVGRALEVGSIEAIIEPARLRPALIDALG